MWRSTLVLAALCVCVWAADPDPDLPDGCTPDANKIECVCDKNITFSEIPTTLPNTTTSLSFKSCTFNIGDELATYTELQILDLHANGIQTIDDNAFATLSKLTTLGLEQNQLKSSGLTAATFAGLTSLTELRLGSNLLGDVDLAEGVFDGSQLAALTSLRLEENSIAKLETKAFKALTKLKTLDVSHNKISQVDFTDASFDSLGTLDLRNNQLTRLEKKQLGGMKKLAELLLDDNSIKTVADDTFEGDIVTSLLKVSLNSNELTPTLSPAFKALKNLHELDLDVNNMFWIEEDTMLNWDSLVTLDVSNNSWECDCRNAWLVDRPIVQNTYEKSHKEQDNLLLTCYSPSKLKGKGVFDVSDSAFDCPSGGGGKSTSHATGVGFAIGLMVGLLVAVIVLVIYCRYTAGRRRASQYSHQVNT